MWEKHDKDGGYGGVAFTAENLLSFGSSLGIIMLLGKVVMRLFADSDASSGIHRNNGLWAKKKRDHTDSRVYQHT